MGDVKFCKTHKPKSKPTRSTPKPPPSITNKCKTCGSTDAKHRCPRFPQGPPNGPTKETYKCDGCGYYKKKTDSTCVKGQYFCSRCASKKKPKPAQQKISKCECGRDRESRSKYCKDHTCKNIKRSGCKKKTSSTHEYCRDCNYRPASKPTPPKPKCDCGRDSLSGSKYCKYHKCKRSGCMSRASRGVAYCEHHRWRPKKGDLALLKSDYRSRRGRTIKKGTGGRVTKIGKCGEYVVFFSNVPGKRRGDVRDVTLSLKLDEIESLRRRLANTVSLTPLQELENLISAQRAAELA